MADDVFIADRAQLNIRVKEFRTEYEPDPTKPGSVREVDYVEWIVKGDQHQTEIVSKVQRLKGGSKISGYDGLEKYYPPAVEWAVIGPAYEAWKKDQTIPLDGTPLDAWPGLTTPQAKIFKAQSVLTVEDIASLTETQIGRVPLPNTREIKERAKAFLMAKSDNSKIEAALSGRDEKIARQEQELADMRAKLDALLAQSGDDPPKRRGRPPRAEQPEQNEAA